MERDGNLVLVTESETWANIAQETGVPEDILRAVNLSIEGELEDGDIVEIPPIAENERAVVLDTGIVVIQDTSQFPQWDQVSQSLAADQITNYDAANGVYIIQQEDGTLAALTPEELLNPPAAIDPNVFDANQATMDWLNAEFSGDLEQFRQQLLQYTFDLLLYSGTFDPVTFGLPEEFDQQGIYGNAYGDFLTALEDVSTQELVYLAMEASESSRNLGYDHQPPYEELASFPEYQARMLEIMGASYISAMQLDDVRQMLHEWQPETEKQFLDELKTEIEKMPITPVWGIPTTHIVEGFRGFHAQMSERHEWLLEIKPQVDEYETQRAKQISEQQLHDDLSLPWWIESAGAVLWEPLDWAITARDFLITGDIDPLALFGLLPLIPSNVFRGIGRVLGNIPGMGMLGRWGGRAIETIGDIGQRFISVDGRLSYRRAGSFADVQKYFPNAQLITESDLRVLTLSDYRKYIMSHLDDLYPVNSPAFAQELARARGGCVPMSVCMAAPPNSPLSEVQRAFAVLELPVHIENGTWTTPGLGLDEVFTTLTRLEDPSFYIQWYGSGNRDLNIPNNRITASSLVSRASPSTPIIADIPGHALVIQGSEIIDGQKWVIITDSNSAQPYRVLLSEFEETWSGSAIMLGHRRR